MKSFYSGALWSPRVGYDYKMPGPTPTCSSHGDYIYIINIYIYILYIMLTYCVLYVYKQICVKVNARRAGSTHWRLEKHKTPSDILQMKR